MSGGRPGGASRHGSCSWECGLHREQGPGSPRSSPGLRARLQRCRPQGARGAEPGPFQPPGTQAPRGTPMRGRRLHRGARSPLRAHGSWPRGHASEASRRPNPRWPQPVPGLGARAGGRQRPTVGGRGARGLGPSRVGRGRPVPASPRQLSPGVASRADLGLGAPLPGAGFPARKHRGPRAPAFLRVTQSSGGRVRDKTDNLPTGTQLSAPSGISCLRKTCSRLTAVCEPSPRYEDRRQASDLFMRDKEREAEGEAGCLREV
ncbi:collagen alpha-1(I) chain-like [Canis lupus familiaris]|uniref:collagen alpha-1(I) chain-like n=1 Tax=Canis lupus familiaris TaxID=9615 RepID=UPI0018F38FEA|nr:collagen alpha-1(I) chain-like [Canis lupus familiaris]